MINQQLEFPFIYSPSYKIGDYVSFMVSENTHSYGVIEYIDSLSGEITIDNDGRTLVKIREDRILSVEKS